MSAWLQNRHAAHLVMLGALILSAAASLAVGLTLLAVIAMNVSLILRLSNAQSEEIGNTQLDVIRSDLQETITEAETDVLYVAMGAEQLMESGASREALAEYFNAQRDKYRASDSFLNVYIAGRDWHIVPDFNAPRGLPRGGARLVHRRRTAPARSTSPSPTWTRTGRACASPCPRCCPTAIRSSAWI